MGNVILNVEITHVVFVCLSLREVVLWNEVEPALGTRLPSTELNRAAREANIVQRLPLRLLPRAHPLSRFLAVTLGTSHAVALAILARRAAVETEVEKMPTVAVCL